MFEFTPTREHVVYFQTGLDLIGCFGCICILAVVTQAYGFGSFRARLQFLHRVGLVLVSAAFAYHAYDIVMAPEKHGLTPPNIILHAALIFCVIISGVRLRRAQLEVERRGGETAGSNGGMFSGPFHR
jgi:hypothetical protein